MTVDHPDRMIDIRFQDNDNLELFLSNDVLRHAVEGDTWDYPCETVVKWTQGVYEPQDPVTKNVHDYINDDEECPMCRMVELYYEHELTN